MRCRDNNVIPRFLNFRLAKEFPKSSVIYAQYQSNLLLDEIRQKKSNVRVFRKESDNLRSSLRQHIKSIDYAGICSKFLESNDLKLKSKFNNLLKEKRSTQDPEKVIFNLSKCVISHSEKSLFIKGSISVSTPCKKLDCRLSSKF